MIKPLPYSYDALEPYIDKETVNIHYEKHHKGYANKLAKALESQPELSKKTLEEILTCDISLPKSEKTFILNNAGGVYNHNFYWSIMAANKGGKPTGELEKAIINTFGSFEEFKKEFSDVAMKTFGSGWTWLVTDKDKNLSIISTSNQDTPIAIDLTPILTIDLWEHAYYLKFQNKRDEYIENWWNLVNWDYANELYTK